MPLPFKDQMRITQEYHKGHPAVDCTGNARQGIAPLAPDVLCVQAGTVVQSRIVTNRGDLTWEWGNYVCVQTANGEKHYYCHLASRAVKVGQKVRVGDKLGVMGNTGRSFGAHLHFERRNKNGKQLDPTPLLGVPNKKGTYYEASQPTQPTEKGQYTMKIITPMGNTVSSKMLSEGVLAVKGADGIVRGYNTKGEARMVRQCNDSNLSATYEAMSAELQNNEMIFIEQG